MDTRKKRPGADIPKTGRIGRFAKIVEKELENERFLDIMTGSENYKTSPPAAKSAWWRGAVERLEQVLGTDGAREIMKQCGAKCCGQGLRRTAVRLMSEADSIEDFLHTLNTYEVKEGELEYTLSEPGTIIGQHNRCFCKQVSKSKEPFPNLTYCHCSQEFNRQFFTAAFGKEVDVEITQSIIAGAESCRFIIRIPE